MGNGSDPLVTLQMSTSIIKAPAAIPLPPAEEIGVPPPPAKREEVIPEVKPKPEVKPEVKPKPVKPKPEVKPEPKPAVAETKPQEEVSEEVAAVAAADGAQTEESSDSSDSSETLNTDNQTAMLETPHICNGASCGGGGAVGSATFSLRELDVKPKAIVNTKPDYPKYAKENRIEGGVTVSFIVDKEGNVLEPKIIKANPPNVFENAALAAVKNWRFTPAKKDGATVNAKINVNVNFVLEGY